jgi:hypothetical protein
MNLTPLHVEILRGARKRVEMSEDGFNSFICYAIEDETSDRHLAESTLLRNRFMFWRKISLYEKWDFITRELRTAINYGLSDKTTVGLWFEREAGSRRIKVDEIHCNNLGLYKQIRLAWLDRAIETGVLK